MAVRPSPTFCAARTSATDQPVNQVFGCFPMYLGVWNVCDTCKCASDIYHYNYFSSKCVVPYVVQTLAQSIFRKWPSLVLLNFVPELAELLTQKKGLPHNFRTGTFFPSLFCPKMLEWITFCTLYGTDCHWFVWSCSCSGVFILVGH